MSLALLSLGSNIEPQRHLDAAVAALRQRFPGARVSRYWRTAAVGFVGDDFLNAGVAIDSDLDPWQLVAWLQALEAAQGRRRGGARFASRTLDVDLVLYEQRVIDDGERLQLPRPDLQYAFVLGPLAEVAPEAVEPRSGRRLAELWAAHPEHVAAGITGA